MDTIKTYNHWKLSVDSDNLLWLSLDRKGSGVNSLDSAVITELDEIITEIEGNASLVGVIIVSAKPSGFIAGANIEQFVTLQDEEQAFALVRQAQQVFDRLATLKIPTVAMINGFCLGGGLELVLACRYRVAEEGMKTQLGAPEVKLGLIPGFGGTVRLPRLVGVLSAMDLNLSGRPINAKAAAKIGLVDAVVPLRHLERAARSIALSKPPAYRPPTWQLVLTYPWVRPLLAKTLNKKLAAKVNKKHYPAPYVIVENWLDNGAKGDEAFVREAKSISKLLVSETSRNLVRVFFLQTGLKSMGKNAHFAAAHVHVIGAGTMGGDIAAWCALRGFNVTLQDRMPELIAPAIKRAHDLFVKRLKQPRLIQAAMDRLIPDTDAEGVRMADVVIEAISENLHTKQALYQSIEPMLKPDAILATNTSSLPLSELSQVLANPERLVGIHFFNPVAMMQLVEVVYGAHTDTQVAAKAMSFVCSLEKLPLLVKSSPGFLVNRILMPYLMEAFLLLDGGVPAAVIDKAAVKFGMPMGPIELADVVGLDVVLAIAEILIPYFGGELPARLQQCVVRGNLGLKSGRGFYQYEHGKRIPTQNTSTYFNLEDISDRLIYRMLNEAAACYREGIVADDDLIDAGMIFGTGFAPFRGGPLHYAKSLGVTSVIAKLQTLADQHGERFKPDEGWREFVQV